MAFLHILCRSLYKLTNNRLQKVFLWFKFKMKIGYECWRQEKHFKNLILDAIQKTIKEQLYITAAQVQKCIKLDDGVPTYATYNSDSEASLDFDLIDAEEQKKRNLQAMLAKDMAQIENGIDFNEI